MTLKQLLLLIAFLAALAGLIVCGIGGKDGEMGWRDQRVFEATSVALPSPASAAVLIEGSRQTPLILDATGEHARLPVEERGAAVVRATPKETPDKTVDVRVSIIERKYGYGAAACGLAMFLLLLLATSPKEKGLRPLWVAISEPEGGLSLGRAQLLLWFVPALGMFCALSVPLLELPRFDPSLAVLFGLSGLTTVVGAAASPEPKDPKVPEPALLQLMENWSGNVDISRVQCFTISVVGALVLGGAFASTMRVPAIPEGFLALLGVSQAAYLGGKAVTIAKDDKGTRTA